MHVGLVVMQVLTSLKTIFLTDSETLYVKKEKGLAYRSTLESMFYQAKNYSSLPLAVFKTMEDGRLVNLMNNLGHRSLIAKISPFTWIPLPTQICQSLEPYLHRVTYVKCILPLYEISYRNHALRRYNQVGVESFHWFQFNQIPLKNNPSPVATTYEWCIQPR